MGVEASAPPPTTGKTRASTQPVAHQILIVIRGARKTGKTSLLARMKGMNFNDQYKPTPIMQATELVWSPISCPNDKIKITVWDVVDHALKLPNIPEGKELPDATTVDTFSRADGVIITYNPADEESINYALSVINEAPENLPKILVANFADQYENPVEIHPILYPIKDKIYILRASMKTNAGLTEIAQWLDIPLHISLKKLYETLIISANQELDSIKEELHLNVEEPEQQQPEAKNEPQSIADIPVDANDFWDDNQDQSNKGNSSFWDNDDTDVKNIKLPAKLPDLDFSTLQTTEENNLELDEEPKPVQKEVNPKRQPKKGGLRSIIAKNKNSKNSAKVLPKSKPKPAPKPVQAPKPPAAQPQKPAAPQINEEEEEYDADEENVEVSAPKSPQKESQPVHKVVIPTITEDYDPFFENEKEEDKKQEEKGSFWDDDGELPEENIKELPKIELKSTAPIATEQKPTSSKSTEQRKVLPRKTQQKSPTKIRQKIEAKKSSESSKVTPTISKSIPESKTTAEQAKVAAIKPKTTPESSYVSLAEPKIASEQVKVAAIESEAAPEYKAISESSNVSVTEPKIAAESKDIQAVHKPIEEVKITSDSANNIKPTQEPSKEIDIVPETVKDIKTIPTEAIKHFDTAPKQSNDDEISQQQFENVAVKEESQAVDGFVEKHEIVPEKSKEETKTEPQTIKVENIVNNEPQIIEENNFKPVSITEDLKEQNDFFNETTNEKQQNDFFNETTNDKQQNDFFNESPNAKEQNDFFNEATNDKQQNDFFNEATNDKESNDFFNKIANDKEQNDFFNEAPNDKESNDFFNKIANDKEQNDFFNEAPNDKEQNDFFNEATNEKQQNDFFNEATNESEENKFQPVSVTNENDFFNETADEKQDFNLDGGKTDKVAPADSFWDNDNDDDVPVIQMKNIPKLDIDEPKTVAPKPVSKIKMPAPKPAPKVSKLKSIMSQKSNKTQDAQKPTVIKKSAILPKVSPKPVVVAAPKVLPQKSVVTQPVYDDIEEETEEEEEEEIRKESPPIKAALSQDLFDDDTSDFWDEQLKVPPQPLESPVKLDNIADEFADEPQGDFWDDEK